MIRQLARCVGEYKKDAILSPVLVAIEVALETIIPLVMAQIIDNGISQGNMNTVVKLGLILVLTACISLLFGVLSGRHAARAAAGFAANIRKRLFHSIQDFSFGNIDRFSNSSLVTRMTTDVTNLQNSFQMIIRICVRAPLIMIFALVMVLRIQPQLAIVFAVAIPVLAIGLYLIMSRAHPIFKKVFKLYDRLNTVVQENLRGIRVVKSYVREDHEIEKFDHASKDIHDNFVKAEKLLAFNAPLMQFCMYACSLAICWLGAQMIVGSTLTTGQLMSVLTYSIQILAGLMIFSMVFVMVTMSQASAKRIVEVLEETSDLHNPEHPVTEIRDGSIRFDHVDFGYRGKDGRMCLQDISLEIKSGQTVGIIGGTGSGKSSLVQLIPRLYDATVGSVLVGGVDVRDLDLKTLRDQVAMVLQKNVLFGGTIRENLKWGRQDATEEEIIHACRLAQADGFIQTFADGYDSRVEQGGSNLSGGQKQRLCIARALLKKPAILILDDSTSAVDTATDAGIRRAFRDEIPDTTKLIIAQRIASVQDADQIIVMDDGKINAVGTHDELLEHNRIYREVWQSQQKGGISDGAA